MSRRKYFIVGAAILVGLEAVDLISTWIYTPDLQAEGNSFVRWYGMGWTGVILVAVAQVSFILIPFYFHCCVFDYSNPLPASISPLRKLGIYFFENHTKLYVSILRALLNGLGFFLFWFFFVHKVTAIGHNTMILIGNSYTELSFSRQMEILKSIDRIFLISIMILFLIGIMYREKNNALKPEVRSIHFSFIIVFMLLFLAFKLYTRYAKPIHSIELAYELDKDIILVNMGEADRAFIAELIKAIDSLKPGVIGINALFLNEKDPVQDSILTDVLQTVKNDILVYSLNEDGDPQRSIEKFRSMVSDQGVRQFDFINGLVSRFTPIRIVKGKEHEDFALKIVKHWKPGFKHTLKANQSIPIRFTRRFNDYLIIQGFDIHNIDPDVVKNNIVIFGSIGQAEEDKFYSPIRLVHEYPRGEPDMYGSIIIANQLRTILEYEEKKK